jgi:hypothetical protein
MQPSMPLSYHIIVVLGKYTSKFLSTLYQLYINLISTLYQDDIRYKFR